MASISGDQRVCALCGRRVSGAVERCPSCGVALPAAPAASGDRGEAITTTSEAIPSPAMIAPSTPAPASAGDPADDDSATRPVPPELLPTTILPPSAAPHPDEAVTTNVGAADAATAAVPGVAGPLVARTQDLPRVPTQKPAQADDHGDAPADGNGSRGDRGDAPGRKAGTRAQAFGTVALVVVLLAIAVGVVLWSSGALGGSTPVPTPTPIPATATVPSVVIGERYTVPGYYEITVPPGWGSASIPLSGPDEFSNMLYTDPTGQYSIEIDVFTPGAGDFPTTPTQADQDALLALDATATHPGQSGPITLAGETFTVETADVTLGNGQTKHYTAMAASHNGKMYVILNAAPTSSDPNAQPSLEQFDFLG